MNNFFFFFVFSFWNLIGNKAENEAVLFNISLHSQYYKMMKNIYTWKFYIVAPDFVGYSHVKLHSANVTLGVLISNHPVRVYVGNTHRMRGCIFQLDVLHSILPPSPLFVQLR